METDRLEKLRKQREVIAARIRREEAKERDKARKADTRRKILAGAVVLVRAETDAAFKADLDQCLARFLVRDDDRALFGLAPLPAADGGSDKRDAAAAADKAAA